MNEIYFLKFFRLSYFPKKWDRAASVSILYSQNTIFHPKNEDLDD